VIDTHEHLWSADELYRQPVDFLATLERAAVQRDLVSASPNRAPGAWAAFDVRQPREQLIAAWWPVWQRVRNTGYALVWEIACRDLFEVDEIRPETIATLDERLAESRKPGWIEHCLTRARIEAVVRDPYRAEFTDQYPALYRFALRIDDFTHRCHSRHALYALEARTGGSIHSLEDLLRAMRRYVEQALASNRVAAFKLAHAYYRPVAIGELNRAGAERSFERLVQQTPSGAIGDAFAEYGADSQATWPELKPLHDYLFHHFFAWAEEFQRPVQVHLGMLDGMGNFLQNSRPEELIPVFLRYPRVRFDLFHAAYPYWRELGVIAKSFPNVSVNLCWTHIISPLGARRALDEWLDVLPASKIFAFGGDANLPECAYAHAVIARGNVFRVLVRRMEEMGWTEKRAAQVARLILFENPKAFFEL
jgi:predicted TIM-barrel fold metal-dependent hydrolase